MATSPWLSLHLRFAVKALVALWSSKQLPARHRSRGCSAPVVAEHQSFSLGSVFALPPLLWSAAVSSLLPTPSLQPTRYSGLRPLVHSGELER
jgi:hypothetical protein